MRVGSLCSGTLGLDMAVDAVLGPCELAWVADNDKAATALLAARAPGVPNLGDLTTVDWADVPTVDVLTAGYPCQPFSTAGRRKGTDDPRHIWPRIADAIRHLRPRLVVAENVAGHLRLGFDSVLADLARLGFDAEWALVRASDIGACHQRRRLFMVAHPGGVGRGPWPGLRTSEPGGLGRGRSRDDTRPPAPDPGSRGRRGWPTSEEPGMARGHGLPAERGEGERVATGSTRPTPHADRGRLEGREERHGEQDDDRGARRGDSDRRPGPEWGRYDIAIERHAAVLGRRAPEPVAGGGLNPAFVEWMMMLPQGWVTDPALGLSRTAQLRLLGNGVVPPQAEAALRLLLPRLATATAVPA